MLSIFRKKKKIPEYKGISIAETEFTVVDTELTGLNELRDTIIAIGGIKMKGKSIKMGEIFYRTIKPDRFVKKDSIMVHEITPSELEECPDIAPILREYLSFVRNSVIVGHCISIDIAFLKKAIHRHLKESYEPMAVDTFVIYKWLIHKGLLPENFINNKSLKDVAISLGIEPKELHDALVDAFITAQVFQKIITLLGDIKIYTTQELMDIGNPNISGYMGVEKKQAFQL
ncbi:3'-5' exonuclease [Thermodesulfovibrio sp. 3907-1M]|uniref:3'-5' exonuclease n=1 Tax=Thermodesulfovibrio autotrophicus TaxID=3118333 RepID=A0AAU8GUG1_9BACT